MKTSAFAIVYHLKLKLLIVLSVFYIIRIFIERKETKQAYIIILTRTFPKAIFLAGLLAVCGPLLAMVNSGVEWLCYINIGHLNSSYIDSVYVMHLARNFVMGCTSLLCPFMIVISIFSQFNDWLWTWFKIHFGIVCWSVILNISNVILQSMHDEITHAITKTQYGAFAKNFFYGESFPPILILIFFASIFLSICIWNAFSPFNKINILGMLPQNRTKKKIG